MNSKNDYYKKLYAPWKFIIIYLVGTLLIFTFGPWSFSNTNFGLLFLFMLVFIIISTLSYKIGIGSIKHEIQYFAVKKNARKPLRTIIVFTFAIASFMLINNFVTKGNPFFGNIFQTMASAYTSISTDKQTETDVPLWIFINLSPIIYSAIILGAFYFRELSRKYKILLVGIFVQLSLYFSLYVGTQKTIGDIIIILISVFMTNLIKKPIKLSKRVLFIITVIAIALFFSSILGGRLLLWNYSFSNTGLSQVDFDNWIFALLPDDLAIGFALFLYYLTHGYYGLSLSLQLPFEWSFGLGSSFEIRDLASRYFGLSYLVDGTTYPERMQDVTGWNAYVNWQTIFPWIASDFTFVGAIFIVSFSAYLYAKAWKEVLIEQKWQSILMFTMLNIQWGYIVANNQLFQTRTTLIMIVFTFIVWILRNKKLNIRIKK